MAQRRRTRSSPTPDGGSRATRTPLREALGPWRSPNGNGVEQTRAMGQLYDMFSDPRTAERVRNTMPGYQWNPMMMYPATGGRTGGEQRRSEFIGRQPMSYWQVDPMMQQALLQYFMGGGQ